MKKKSSEISVSSKIMLIVRIIALICVVALQPSSSSEYGIKQLIWQHL